MPDMTTELVLTERDPENERAPYALSVASVMDNEVLFTATWGDRSDPDTMVAVLLDADHVAELISYLQGLDL